MQRTGHSPRAAFDLNAMPLFWRCYVICTLLAVAAGAAWGFDRGLYHLPTLPFAIIEGAILFGVPGALVGIAVAGGVTLLVRLGRGRR
jgi:hypothetical protein